MEKARVIAIDPASVSGYCVFSISQDGTVKKEVSGSIGFKQRKIAILSIHDAANARYGRFYGWLEDLIVEGKEKSEKVIVAVEEAANFTRGKAAIVVAARIFGAASSCCYRNNVLQVDVTPGDIKKFATGRGNAPKEDVVAAMKNKYGFITTDDNEADAYALGMLIVENINAYIQQDEQH